MRSARLLSPLAFSFLLLALLVSASCASSRSLTIQSDPTGGDVYLDGEYVGVAPVTIPFVYGGEREITVYPARRAKASDKKYAPKRVMYDTTRDAYDTAVIDIAADIVGGKDKQTVTVKLDESHVLELFDTDKDAWCAGARARANTLRVRARELQLSALPTNQGRDPGPLESRPASRGQPANPPSH